MTEATDVVDPVAFWRRYPPYRIVFVREVVLTELAALVTEAFPSEDVDYATACAHLLDLVQQRELALVRGALPLPPRSTSPTWTSEPTEEPT